MPALNEGVAHAAASVDIDPSERQLSHRPFDQSRQRNGHRGHCRDRSGGHIIGLLRMDDAKLASIGVAEGKAWTAALFQRASVDYNVPAAPGGNSYGVLNAYPGKLVPLPGGQPIFVEGTCIGGIGISGASGEQDDSLAKAAVAALMNKDVA
jgi:uncharacterized protein GlcG (DUF336 family)